MRSDRGSSAKPALAADTAMSPGGWSMTRTPCALLVLVLAFAEGCSLFFVKPPPPGPLEATPPAACTASVAAPVVDTVLSAASLAGGIYLAVSNKNCSSDLLSGLCKAEQYSGYGLIAASVPLAVSAGLGYARTGECHGVHETQLACLSGVERSCQTLRERAPANAPESQPAGQ
jgi:hypothetical protein